MRPNIKQTIMNVNLFDRILMAIPFLRHRMAKRSVQDALEEQKLLHVVNQSFLYLTSPNLVKLYNEGKIDNKAMCSPEYHMKFIVHMFGKKAIPIADQLKFYKAHVKSLPEFTVYLMHIPSDRTVGQNDMIAFVISPKGKAFFYSWEWSLNNNKMIGTMDNKNHCNYGICNDKSEFVKRIIEITMSIE